MNSFDLDHPIYEFNDHFPFTIRDACEGVQIFGGIGSGKTSGSGAALARAYLKAGFGGLVLCAKKDELATWQEYARQTGREESLVVFDTSGALCFPFLQYEIDREGEGAGYTENLVRMFATVQEAINRSSGGDSQDPYWKMATQQLMRNAIDLCMIARGNVSVGLLAQVVQSAPRSTEETRDSVWMESSLCYQLLMEGHQKELDKWIEADFETSAKYWLLEFPAMNDKSRSSIISMFTSTIDNFQRRPFRMLFAEPPNGKTQIAFPELTHEGMIIVMNMSVKEYGNAGRAAQVLYKYMWQQAAERRDVKKNPRPIFLWIDEAQNFTTEYDSLFISTSRSSRACTVYLTQNLPAYYSEMGGKESRDRVNSLVGNLQTKIWHANSDSETNHHAAETIGKSWQVRRGSSESFGADSFNYGQSANEAFEYDVPPQTFTRLSKGGPLNDRRVQGVVFQNGRSWHEGSIHLLATFKQL